jgi:hypothetical protein
MQRSIGHQNNTYRRLFTSVHSTDSLHGGAQIIRSCARLGPIGFRSRQCRMTICSSSAAGCPFIHSRPAKVRISWFTHTHCSPACKAAGTQTLRTTAPLETAFDTALAEVASFAALPRPARRTLRLSGPARKARSPMAKMSPGGRGSLASVLDAQAVRALCDAQAAAGELADGDGESGGGEA